MKDRLKAAYDKGYIDGLSCYAYHSKGVLVVGALGRSLKNAIEEREKFLTYNNNLSNYKLKRKPAIAAKRKKVKK